MPNSHNQPRQSHAKNYATAAWALAPMALYKGVIDIPEGAIDKLVQDKVSGVKLTRATAKKAIIGRGWARGAAHVPTAIITAPLYFSGMKDLKSDDSRTRKKGAAKVALAGGALGLGKGFTESALEAYSKGGKAALKQLKGSFGRVGLTRMAFGIGTGLLTAKAVAKTDNVRDKGKTTFSQKYTLPALAGAVGGGIKGATEWAVKDPKMLKQLGFRKGIVAPAAGRAVAGALGGAVLGELFNKFKGATSPKPKPPAPPKVPTYKPPKTFPRTQGQVKTAAWWPFSRKPTTQQEEAPMHIPGMAPGIAPFPHQKKAIERMMANNGSLVIAHGVGSGKTETALMAEMSMKALGRSTGALVIVPAGLRQNFADRIKKRTNATVDVIGPKGEKGSVTAAEAEPGKDFYVIGYELFRQSPDLVEKLKPSTMILDEYHKVRNPQGSTYKAIMAARPHVNNFIGMTGSIVNNNPAEIAPLVSLATGDPFMTTQRFKQVYQQAVASDRGFFGGKKPVMRMRNIPQLQQQIGPYVDYISSEQAAGDKLPKRTIETVETPMSKDQERYYRFVLNQVNPIVAWKIRNNVDPSDRELGTVFQQLMKVRQISNSIHTIDPNMTPEQSSFATPKVNRLLQDTQEHLTTTPDGQVVIFSNLVRGGADVVMAGLKARNIPFGVFMGKGKEVEGVKSTEESRTKAVNDYLAGKIKVIVITGAGAEGLDLGNTTMVQSLDGHFNPERILQAEARGRRTGGLSHRAPQDRQVMMKRYVSTFERGILSKMFGQAESSVDQYVYNVAGRKAALNRQLLTALSTAPQQRRPDLRQELARVQPAITGTNTLAQPPVIRTEDVPPGTELVKNPETKYEKRYRKPDGSITYKYPDDSVQKTAAVISPLLKGMRAPRLPRFTPGKLTQPAAATVKQNIGKAVTAESTRTAGGLSSNINSITNSMIPR